MVIHPLARAREALQFYREYTRSSPDELTVDAAIVTAPDGNAVLGFIPCYCGAPVEGEKMLASLRAFGPPVADLVRPMTVTEAHALSDPFSPAGRNYYFRAYGLPQMNAWNKGDAKMYSQTFAMDSTCTNILGVNYVTRDALEPRVAGSWIPFSKAVR